ncbi:SDR family oxidoreductase [Halomonas denitrificans]|nr:SDR family oxidoreductase [Halomonas denitrificans]
MKVLVAGATGSTGARVVEHLQVRAHVAVALVRSSSDTSVLPEGVETRTGDLTDLRDDVCDGCDAVIFAAGSGADTDADMTDRVDRDGAMALVDRAKAAGVQRFVMLSSAGAESPDPESELGHYLKAKHDADEYLKASGLSYAIVRPVALTDDDGEREVRFGDEVEPDGEAARGDVASVLVDALASERWRNRTARMESIG